MFFDARENCVVSQWQRYATMSQIIPRDRPGFFLTYTLRLSMIASLQINVRHHNQIGLTAKLQDIPVLGLYHMIE